MEFTREHESIRVVHGLTMGIYSEEDTIFACKELVKSCNA